jgi:hypothetical protein
MSDFLDTALWIFDFLVLQLLPVIAVSLIAIFIYKIFKAIGDNTEKFIEDSFKEVKKG